MTTYLLIGALLGWFGHGAVAPACEPNPLVVASCIDPIPPSDESFGATTYSLTTTVRQSKKCNAACLGVKK